MEVCRIDGSSDDEDTLSGQSSVAKEILI